MSYVTAIIFAGATLLLLLSGLLTWQVDRSSRSNQALFVFCVLLAIGNFGQIFSDLSVTRASCEFWYHVSWLGWALYPTAAVVMALYLTERERLLSRWLWLCWLLPAVFFLLRSFTVLVGVVDFVQTRYGTFAPVSQYGFWDIAYVVYQYGFDLGALALIGQWGFASGSRRIRLQAIIILTSALCAILIDAIRYFFAPHGELAAMWAVGQAVFALGLSYSITRLRFTVPTAKLAAEHIIEHVKDLVMLVTLDGTILSANASAKTLLGYAVPELVGKPFIALLCDEITEHALRTRVFQEMCGGMNERDVTLRTKDGTRLPIALTCAEITDSFHDVIGVVVIGEDLRQTQQLRREIQERTRAEEALREADRAKDRVLATLSHELLTPLTIIFAWIDVTKGDPSRMAQALDIIAENARRQHRSVVDLLEVSRIIHGKMTLNREQIDLSQLVTQCAEESLQLTQQRGIRLRLRAFTETLPVFVDPIRIRQVIENLMGNALKCTPADGVVTVAIARDGDRAVLSFADTGRGIPSEEQARIFLPFVQGTGEEVLDGLGLGLAVAKGIVELHDGTVTVESAGVDQGCVFTVTLPLVVDKVPAPTEGASI